MATKAELRRRLKEIRLAMPPDDRDKLSTEICVRLKQSTNWADVKTLHCYEPITRFNEVNISPFLQFIQSRHSHIQVYVPHLINDEWRLLSLNNQQNTTPVWFDAVIVPMLGFDSKKHRIGYGGGYYDKFLAHQTHAQKIGVSFEAGKLDHIPVKPHDIPLDLIITEQDTYS
jgi:5-formyltetrahydrofolate cyclo-ligase